MAGSELFESDNYKSYLKSAIARLPKKGRGFRSRMAQELRCQSAYVSQILNGNAHLSLEQAVVLSQMLGHSEDESRFFLRLVEYARAGSAPLRSMISKEIAELREKRQLIRERFKTREKLSSEDQLRYYSDWFYVALHVLSSIPRYQSTEGLQKALNLPLETIINTLTFLIECGLVVKQGNRYSVGKTRIHLGSDSPLISKHHINWRLQAMISLERKTDQDLHYTSVVSVGKQDLEKLRRMLVNTMEQYNQVIDGSPDEECYCLAVDFFKVTEK